MESKSKFVFEYLAPTMLADKKQNMEHQIHYRRLYLGGRLAVVGVLGMGASNGIRGYEASSTSLFHSRSSILSFTSFVSVSRSHLW